MLRKFGFSIPGIAFAASGDGPDPFLAARERMVAEQIRARGVRDMRVLEAMRKIPRHLFVPPNSREQAYADHPVAIGFGQTVSQPFIVAYMSEALRLESNCRVLEIGTGCGYQAAVLAELVSEVYSVELIPELAKSAGQRLIEMGYRNIKIRSGNGFQGWPQAGPFDAIMVTAAPETLPRELVAQLKIGGRMIVPVGSLYQELVLVTRNENGADERRLLPVRFVPMVSPRN